MTTRPQQLALDLALEPRLGRDDFLEGAPNTMALALIDRWPDWSSPFQMIIGPEGAGKTHLAAIWAAETGALVISAPRLRDPALLAVADAPAIGIEDADRLGDNEANLFHLVNLCREHDRTLLMTARTRPEAWGIRTPDLASRLRLAPVTEIMPPDDALLGSVLVKQFADRQLLVDPGVVEFLLDRIERSFAATVRIAEQIDRDSLALGRRVTKPLVSTILTRMADGENVFEQ